MYKLYVLVNDFIHKFLLTFIQQLYVGDHCLESTQHNFLENHCSIFIQLKRRANCPLLMPLTHKYKTRTESTAFYWRIIGATFCCSWLILLFLYKSVIGVDLVWMLTLPATGNVLASPEIILTSSHKRDWNFLWMGKNSVRPKHLKKCSKLDWKFSRSGRRILK